MRLGKDTGPVCVTEEDDLNQIPSINTVLNNERYVIYTTSTNYGVSIDTSVYNTTLYSE